MRKIDKDGFILCELQAKAFEMSATMSLTSSEIFIRRFMNSQITKSLDSGDVLQTNIQAKDVLERIEEQYGSSEYGSVKYTENELYWIGYIYRYFSYTYYMSSVQVYKIVKPKELRGLFLPYHTMDPAQAIERILEAKNLLYDEEEELRRQYKIFRRIRNEK
ncbi:MAG: antitoxin [Lachnospiraceae bacterium]|nr:antitoxin [Lachnospiraceae bacterium]MEE1516018.1 antitoxin [Lachnospiraceae bacterium]